jgi:glycine/D-amino acid oxidase-like deaminating enzyme
MSRPVRHVVIVGGGSAGWLTAGIIAAEHCGTKESGLRVTLIESPDVKTIGVGEGTWPSMRDTLRHMGVSETEFVRACDASFKQGSKFVGWVTGGEDDVYYHPFVLPQGYTEANLVARWQSRYPDTPFASLVSFQPHLCENGKAPKQAATPEFAAVANYAYHLDAGKFGDFLKKHCVDKLGVSHVLDHVEGVVPAENGDIDALETSAHGKLEGDLFIDCTGFASLLIGKHYDVPFVSRKEILFNDSALALQVPYEEDDSPIASQTTATAQTAGWIWDIGLPTRRGIGHVYSSSHTSDEAAESELRAYVAATSGTLESDVGPRKITFNPGHRDTFWHRNCVAVGISAGFIEPLEASALALIELSAAMIRDEMPANRDVMDIVAGRFNETFRYRWDRIMDFLKLHYVLSQRTDSDYWKDNRRPDSIPERLAELLQLWKYQPPSRRDVNQIEEIFPSASYQYVLYGMGFRPEDSGATRRSADAAVADRLFSESAGLAGKMLAGLPTTRELINHINRRGLPRGQ